MSSPHPSAYRQLRFAVAVVFLQSFAVVAAPDEEWLPVKYVDLEVEAGSPLDFSALVEPGPAGRHGWSVVLDDGHIGFEALQKPQRFFCASIAFSGASGGMPDRDEAERLAIQLQRTGYNAVRLHFVDAMLMSGRDKDFDFDLVQLDRFHYFLSRLKARGIYWVWDALDSDNGAFGGVYPNRWVKKHDLKLDVYTDPAAREHWLQMVKMLLGAKNPHTGLTSLEDPALIALVLVNEGGIAELSYRSGQRYSPKLAPAFTSWLKAKYANDTALRQAWSGDLDAKESLQGVVEVPKAVRGTTARSSDFMRFATDLEGETLRWMTARVRSLGYRGLVTAFNNFGFHQTDLTRSAVDLVDMHAYHTTPTAFTDKESRVLQSSAIPGAGRFVRELTNARQWSKPFAVTEYGQPFWNSWRRESIALVPAYAAMQNWDLITQFAENAVQLDYRNSPHSRRQAIYPYGIGTDPILRAGERLAALLFKRRDVAPATSEIHVHLDRESIFSDAAGWAQLSENVSRLGLVTAIGLDVERAPSPATNRKIFLIDKGSNPTGLMKSVSNAVVRLGFTGTGNDRVGELLRRGILPAGNQTDFAKEVFQSGTGELLLDVPKKSFLVNTPKTALVTIAEGEARVGALAVRNLNVPALVAISSLDDAPLQTSRHLLLTVLSDAMNSDMKFADAKRTELVALGHLPVLLQRVKLDLRMNSRLAGVPRVHALSLSGQRRDRLPTVKTGDGFELHVDTGLLSTGPTTFFEITWDQPAGH